MQSHVGMATRRRDVDLCFAQVSALSWNFGLAWLGLAVMIHYSTIKNTVRNIPPALLLSGKKPYHSHNIKSFPYLDSIVTIDGGDLDDVHTHIRRQKGT
jgi:hypothetical protein